MAREPISKRTVILDVGGDRFIAMRTTLERYPATRLGKLMRAASIQKILEYCDEFVPGNPPEYFFESLGLLFMSDEATNLNPTCSAKSITNFSVMYPERICSRRGVSLIALCSTTPKTPPFFKELKKNLNIELADFAFAQL